MQKEDVLVKLKELEIRLGRRPVKRDNSHLYQLSRKYFGTWNNMMVEYGYNCKGFQKPSIPKKINSNLSYFLGLVSTDGHIQVTNNIGKYKIMVHTSEIEEVDLIKRLVNSLFNYNASIYPRKTGFKNSRINYEVYIYSKDVAYFLNSLGIPFGAKSANIRVPQIFITGREFIWDYIRGVFDGDGSIIFSGYNSIFKISSGSLNFLQDLLKIFQSNAFNHFKIYKNGENVWDLRNNTKTEILKIHNLIYDGSSFFYPRKKLKWAGHYV